MVRRLLSLVLAATIVSCPYRCMLTSATAKATGQKHHSCCDCCHENEQSGPAQKSDTPNNCPTKSGKTCQCICGGAVSDAGSPPDIGLDTSVWTDLPAEFRVAPSAVESAYCISISQLQPD